MKTKISTPKAEFRYVFVTGEGRDLSMPGEEANMNFTASVIIPKNSPELKVLKDKLESAWEDYKKEEPKAKGVLTFGARSKCAAIKTVMVEVEDKNDIDPETDKVRKVETEDVIITFKTATTWPDGNDKVVKKYATKKDANGVVYADDVTGLVDDADWTIGNGSTGIMHGLVIGNTTGGSPKLSIYLTAIQIGKLVKYEGDVAEIVDMELDEDEISDWGDEDISSEEGEDLPEV